MQLLVAGVGFRGGGGPFFLCEERLVAFLGMFGDFERPFFFVLFG